MPSTTPDRDVDATLGPPPPTDNLTARAARWSAAHRRTAVLGWIAFVIAAFAAGTWWRR